MLWAVMESSVQNLSSVLNWKTGQIHKMFFNHWTPGGAGQWFLSLQRNGNPERDDFAELRKFVEKNLERQLAERGGGVGKVKRERENELWFKRFCSCRPIYILKY